MVIGRRGAQGARAAVGLLLLAGLPACGADDPATPAEPAPALSAEVKQYRRDIATRILSVAVTNPGGSPVVVERLALAAPGFDPVPLADVDVELPPGQRVDVKVPYGPARCDGPPAGGPDEASAVVRTEPGTPHDVQLVLPTDGGLLERLRTRECAGRELARTVTIALSPAWERQPDRLTGSLVLTRAGGDAAVTVTEPGGNILFTVEPPAPTSPLGVMPAGASRAEVPLQVRATRCDGHALAESKRSYVFLFFVSVDGGTPLQTTTTADEPLQRQLDRLALDTCRPG